MMTSSYLIGNSVIHKLHPGIKIVCLIVLTLLLLWLQDWRWMIVAFLCVSGLFFLATLPIKLFYQQFKPSFYLVVIIFLCQLMHNNWQISLVIAIRVIILILFASLITITTSLSGMMSFINSILRWLKYVGINPNKISLSFALTLRFIPIIITITQEVKEAQKAKGLDKHIIALVIPIIIRILKAADDIANAIDARGYS